jgi:RNA polymerase sigma-70 factor (ECF subfamily)
MTEKRKRVIKMMNQPKGNGQPESNHLSLEDAMEQYQTALLRYATRVLNNADAAEDVVQEAFIRLHDNMEKIIKRSVPLKGWLFRTTHNAAVDYIRKESRRRTLHKTQSEPFVSNGKNSGNDREELVLQHLNILKPKEREVLVLRLQEGMSYREIAQTIKRSEGYVGTLIHSATKKLSKSLRQAGVIS